MIANSIVKLATLLPGIIGEQMRAEITAAQQFEHYAALFDMPQAHQQEAIELSRSTIMTACEALEYIERKHRQERDRALAAKLERQASWRVDATPLRMRWRIWRRGA